MSRFEYEMPDPGEGITEGTVVDWRVEEGQAVAEDDPMADVETDKAIVELPVPVTGTVTELVAREGDVVHVGDVIAVLDTEEESVPDQERTEGRAEEIDEDTPAEEDQPDDGGREREEEVPSTEAGGGQAVLEARREPPGERVDQQEVGAESRTRVFAAPSTRRYARERGIDLTEIEGSGPGGRVLRADVDSAREATPRVTPSQPATEPTPVEADEGRSTRRPLTGLRKRIAENMVRSATRIPHVTSGFECDATELVALKERLDEKLDVRITYVPILLKAVIPSLKAFPIVNASVDETTDEIVEKHYYDVGFATHTDDGLLVPVVQDVDRKSLVEVAEEIETLAEQARERSIDVADLRGGTFTVTNLGTRGEHRRFGTPIINYPQAAILGIGRIRREPVAVGEDAVEVRPRLDLTLSYDHRIIDGVTANEFVESLIERVEDPDLLLASL